MIILTFCETAPPVLPRGNVADASLSKIHRLTGVWLFQPLSRRGAHLSGAWLELVYVFKTYLLTTKLCTLSKPSLGYLKDRTQGKFPDFIEGFFFS